MGFLRFLMASMVLASHAGGVVSVFLGTLAVECFYVISGFYIQLIIREFYSDQPHWRRKFYESRILRIFPSYWIFLFTLALFIPLAAHHSTFWQHLLPVVTDAVSRPGELATWLHLLPNLFILGSEHIKLFQMSSCGEVGPVIVGQIWSVGIELIFYAVAPFILLLSTRALVAIVLAGIAGKALLLSSVPWAPFALPCGDVLLNDIFPFELAMFLLGSLDYRYYQRYLQPRACAKPSGDYTRLLACVAIATAAVVAGLGHLHVGDVTGAPTLLIYYAYVLVIVLVIPFLFHASRQMKIDRFVGELSYCIYLVHYNVIRYFEHAWSITGVKNFLIAEVVACIIAAGMVLLIEEPISRFRARHFHRA